MNKTGKIDEKNHGGKDDFLEIDGMRENLFRLFREIQIFAVIFRPPEATCRNRRDFGGFKLLNLVQIPSMVCLVVIVGASVRPEVLQVVLFDPSRGCVVDFFIFP